MGQRACCKARKCFSADATFGAKLQSNASGPKKTLSVWGLLSSDDGAQRQAGSFDPAGDSRGNTERLEKDFIRRPLIVI
jgi:hypothetical protein